MLPMLNVKKLLDSNPRVIIIVLVVEQHNCGGIVCTVSTLGEVLRIDGVELGAEEQQQELQRQLSQPFPPKFWALSFYCVFLFSLPKNLEVGTSFTSSYRQKRCNATEAPTHRRRRWSHITTTSEEPQVRRSVCPSDAARQPYFRVSYRHYIGKRRET